MKSKFISGVVLAASVLTLAACSTKDNTNTTNAKDKTTQTTKNKETKASYEYVKDATFYVGRDGKAIKESEVPKDALILDWYLDPYCPACVKLEDLVKDTNKSYLAKENMVIRYHALSFLSPRTVDDYSTRASAWILGVTEETPDLSTKYLNAILTASFRPDGKAKADAEFKAAFLSVGGTEAQWKKITSRHNELKKSVEKNTALAFNDESLEKKSPTGSLFTPFVIVGDNDKALNFEGSMDAVEYYKDEVNAQLKKQKEKTEDKEETKSSESETKESSSSDKE